MSATPLRDAITEALTAQFAPVALEVVDDSAAHAGHAGAREGAHFNVRIVSARGTSDPIPTTGHASRSR